MVNRKNLVGEHIGMLYVKKETDQRKDGKVVYECMCECGNIRFFNTKDLRRNKSCGCLRKKSPSNVVDITGKTFGKLFVIKRNGRSNVTQEAMWLCRCECTNEITVLGSSLRDEKTKSCGCLLPPEKQIKDVHKHIQKNLTIDGVNTSSLKRKVQQGSKTGVKGVYQRPNGKYEAYITVKGNRHHLGTYNNLTDATRARKDGEKQYHKPYLDQLEDDE